MAQTIKLKRSATQNAVPSTSSLALGEIALNTYDGKLFIKKDVGGTESIVTIGAVGAGSIGPTELASTAVTAGSYGSTSAIPVITIDADGRITSASTATISGLSANSVTSTEIAANAVGISELDVTDGTDGQVLTTDGSGTLTFEDQSGGAASANAFATNVASGNGSTATFTLSSTPSAESKIIAFINGVFQNQDAYTISGTDITFDTAPISGTNNVVIYVIGDVYSGESVLISNFDGDSSTTAFTLSNNPGNENNTQVYIDGVYQQKTTYSVSGTTLTFSSAPPTGTANIEVVMLTSTTVNTPAAGSVVTASMADDSVTGAKIVSSAVTTAKIADVNVTTAKIADANITTAKIANDAVTIGKIADAALVIESEGISSNDNDTTLPTSAAVKDYVDGKDFETGLAGDSGTGTVNTSQTLTVSGTANEVNTSVSGQTVTVGLPDSVSLTSNLTVGGYIAGPSSFTIDPAGVGDNTGTVVIAGNLQVDGTQTTINSTSMSVDDLNLTLASGAANAAAANGAGLTIDGASATLLYASSGDKFVFNKTVDVTGNLQTTGYLAVNGTSGNTGSASDRWIGGDGTAGTWFYNVPTGSNHYFAVNNSNKLGINSSGIDITGSIVVSGTVDGVDIAARDAVLTSTTTTAGAALPKAGGTMTGAINMGAQNITNTNRITLADGLTDTGQAGSATVFNESGSTADFRIESTSSTHMLFVDSGNNSVGIGNSQPSATYKLDVGGAVRSSATAPSFNLQETDASNQHWVFGSYGGTAAIRDVTGGTYPIQIQAATPNNTLYLKSDGKVGIGTSNPLQKLHVNGHILLGDNTTDASYFVHSGTSVTLSADTDVGIVADANDTSGTAPAGIIAFGAGSSTNTDGNQDFTEDEFGNSGLPRLEYGRFHSNGYFGIGTNAPAAKLAFGGLGQIWVNNDASNPFGIDTVGGELRLFTGNSATYQMKFGKMATDGTTFTSHLTIGDDGSNRGNVGIGTDSPSHTLHVVSSGNGEIKAERTSGAAILIQAQSANGKIGTSSNHNLGLNTNGTTRLTIDTNGNVGIGTSSPAQKLHVSGNVTIDTDANSKFTIGDGGTDAITLYGGSGDELYIGANAAYKLRFKTDGNIVMDNGGSLGIGTSSPAHPLSVQAANAKITACSTADSQVIGFQARYLLDHATLYGSFEYHTGDAQLYIDNNFTGNNGVYGDINFRNKDNGGSSLVSRMKIKGSTGNVGIGTTDPKAKLHVQGDAFIGEYNGYETEMPSNSATLHIHEKASGSGVALGDETHVVISTGATSTGAQGYQGSLWFGTSDHPAGGSATNSTGTQFVWRNAGIASGTDADTGAATGNGNLEFYTNNGGSSGTKRLAIERYGNIETALGVPFHAATGRTGGVNITTSYTNVLNMSSLGSGGARGFYLVTVVRQGGTVGTAIIMLIGTSSTGNSYIYDTLISNSLQAQMSGSWLQIKMSSGGAAVHATAVPIGLTGVGG